MRLLKTTLLLLLVFVVKSQGQETTPMTLDAAIKHAQEHSAAIKDALINIADADGQIIERRAIGLPKVSGSLEYQYFFKVPTQQLPAAFEILARDPVTGQLPPGFSREVQFSLKHNFTAGISANSLLFDRSYLTGLKAAKVYRKYVDQELIQKKREVHNAVVEAYLPPLLLDESIGMLDRNKKTLQQLLHETTEMYKAGFVEQLDVDRLQLSLSNLDAQRESLLRQRETALTMLKYAISFPLEKELDIADDIDKLLIEATSEELDGAVNYNARPEYKVVELGKQLSELNVELFKHGLWPNVAAFASYQYGYQGNKLDDTGFWAPTGVVGAQVNIPIFDGFENKAKKQRAMLDLERVQSQKQELERGIALEVKAARLNYRNAAARVTSQKENIALAEKIYNTTEIKYKEGVGSSLELAQAEQSLFQTQQNYTQAVYDLLVAKSGLDKALGR